LWLLIPGMVGQTSLLNTFSHFHIPIEISLFRVALGLALGYALGRLVAFAINRCSRLPA
jgi:ABC-type nitrate/sulfonate/bicarbonate transport system permease component